MPLSRPSLVVPALLVPLLAGGCGWVDSTGRQTADSPTEDASASDAAVASLDPDPLALAERTRLDVRLEGEDGRLEGWRWRALDEPGEPLDCARVIGFDTSLAERTLEAACSDPEDCAIETEERRDALGTRVTLGLPALRSPLAARVALSTTDGDGRPVERRRTLCGVSINEAPEAGTDRIGVVLGATLSVEPGDAGDLLANDVDDVDVRNAPLSIDPRPARAPRHASRFELGTDGGFVYRPRDDALDGGGGALEDSFAYRLSDGLHEVVGEVVILITDGSADNAPPRALEPLEDIEIALDPVEPVDVRIDLSTRVVDPDGDPLTFSVTPDSLPRGGTLALGSDGVLRGRPGLADLGRWRVTLVVDDGRERLLVDLTLNIVRAFEANARPIVTDIANRVVSGRFDYDVSPFFDDPDGDRLRFSASGLPKGVSIDAAGTVSGRVRKDNRGSWFVVVSAEDGRGGAVTDGFRLTLR